MSEKKGVLDQWEDFELMNDESESSAASIYESYLQLRECFQGLPKNELISRGWISSKDDVGSLAVILKEMQTDGVGYLFRKNDTADKHLALIWLSRVKFYAKALVASKKIADFQGIEKGELKSIARLSVDVEILLKLPAILAEKGIVLVYCRALPGMKLDGAVFKLVSGNPVIGISLRFPRLDNFWFTLMHELAHLALHIDILDKPILDDLEVDSASEIEISANHLAKYSFVDRQSWRNCEAKYNKSRESIEKFAKKIGIHKSIVAGMLRKEEGDYRAYSNIVNDINVRKVIFGND